MQCADSATLLHQVPTSMQTQTCLPPVLQPVIPCLILTPLCARLPLPSHTNHSVLQPEEAKMLLASPNPPLFVLSAIGQLLAAADMRIESKTHMDESIRVLQEAAGSCEKIITTPIPLSYTRCGPGALCWCPGFGEGAGGWGGRTPAVTTLQRVQGRLQGVTAAAQPACFCSSWLVCWPQQSVAGLPTCMRPQWRPVASHTVPDTPCVFVFVCHSMSACRHTGRFLVLWITCLPFVIWQELGWLSVPVSMIVSFLLFGIEVRGGGGEEMGGWVPAVRISGRWSLLYTLVVVGVCPANCL